MTPKELKIIELLRLGKSYSYIQQNVEVSPSKIASVKRIYMDNGSEGYDCTTTKPLPATTTVNTDSSDTTTDYLESQNKLIINLKNKLTMNSNNNLEDDDLDLSEKAFLEKTRLEMAHEIAMRRLDKDDEELEIRKKELELKEKSASAENKKIEKEGRSLIYRFRKLAEKVENAEWTYGDIDDCSEKATELKEEIEKYCFENEIDTNGLSILIMLNKIETEFENLQLDNADEDDTIEVEFDDEVLEMIERANELDFNSYE